MTIATDAGRSRTKRIVPILCAAALGLWLRQPADAQIGFAGTSDLDWTVVTMAPDGAWGAATEGGLNHAIADAVARCRLMSRLTLGCGAYMVSTQGGWVLGVRCGGENILRTGETFADAVESARRRELQLRALYRPSLATCRQVVVVTPDGSVGLPRFHSTTSDAAKQ
jgi:hypothetical protein